MTHSYTEIYLHVTWQTKYRDRLLTGSLEEFVHDRTPAVAEDQNLSVLAFNSAWDHVHGLFRWHATVTVAEAVRAMKSKVAVEWNKSVREGRRTGELLEWQSGYGAISIRRGDVETVCNYIARQKQHHRRDETWRPFERIDPPDDEAS